MPLNPQREEEKTVNIVATPIIDKDHSAEKRNMDMAAELKPSKEMKIVEPDYKSKLSKLLPKQKLIARSAVASCAFGDD